MSSITSPMLSLSVICLTSHRELLGRIMAAVTDPSDFTELRLVSYALAMALVDEAFISYVYSLNGVAIVEYYAWMPHVSVEFALNYYTVAVHLAYRIPQYTEDIIVRLGDDINWEAVSRASPGIDIMRKHAHHLDWRAISGRVDITENILDEFIDHIHIVIVSARRLATWFVIKHVARIDWNEHSAVCAPEVFIHCKRHIRWSIASRRTDLDAMTIYAFRKKWKWDILLPIIQSQDDLIVACSKVIELAYVSHWKISFSEELLYRLRDELNWEAVLNERAVSEQLLRRVTTYLNWRAVDASMCHLSAEFIRDYADKLDLKYHSAKIPWDVAIMYAESVNWCELIDRDDFPAELTPLYNAYVREV
jgi:hypothetical protein